MNAVAMIARCGQLQTLDHEYHLSPSRGLEAAETLVVEAPTDTGHPDHRPIEEGQAWA